MKLVQLYQQHRQQVCIAKDLIFVFETIRNEYTISVFQSPTIGRTTTKNEKRSANTLYQELSFQDNEESEENEVTGKTIHTDI